MDRHDLIAGPWVAASIADVREAALRWLTSAALTALVASLGGPILRKVPEDLPAFMNWTTNVLDTRGGAERHEAVTSQFSAGAAAALIGAAAPLGLLETAPPVLAEYDVTVVLGGTVTGNQMRSALAASLPSTGVNLGLVVGLAAHRPLTTAEISAGPGPIAETTEWQHLFRAVCEAFGLSTQREAWPPHSSDFHTAIDETLTDSGGECSLRLMAAPTTDPSRRANTADALAFLARRIPADHRRRVLVITSAIYVPYQFLTVAPCLLGDGSSHVEVIGTPTAVDGDQNLLAQRVGQEVHAAVAAAARLWPLSA